MKARIPKSTSVLPQSDNDPCSHRYWHVVLILTFSGPKEALWMIRVLTSCLRTLPVYRHVISSDALIPFFFTLAWLVFLVQVKIASAWHELVKKFPSDIIHCRGCGALLEKISQDVCLWIHQLSSFARAHLVNRGQ